MRISLLDDNNIVTTIVIGELANFPNGIEDVGHTQGDQVDPATGAVLVRAPLETAASAREWRNNELLATDWVVPIIDHPEHDAYMLYRVALREWPSTVDFPNTKPELGS